MTGPEFASCWLKIERAEEHFNTFYAELREWNETNPYSLVFKPDPEGRRHGIVANINGLPNFKRWALITGDCIHNLRSALDHLVYALAIRDNGGPVADAKAIRSIQFPIGSDAMEFEKAASRVAALKPGTKTAIERIQSYNRFNPPLPLLLPVLRELDNADKHRTLTLALNHVAGFRIQFDPPLLTGMPKFNLLGTAVYSGAEVVFFFLDPPDLNVSYQCYMEFAVTVAHAPGSTGKHVSVLDHLLTGLIAEVKSIVAGSF